MLSQQQRELLALHRALDGTSRTARDRRFVSGWQTDHPYTSTYFDKTEIQLPANEIKAYKFLSDSRQLAEAIQAFHHKADGISLDPSGIFASSGSSVLVFSFFLLLKSRGIRTIYYVPPIYYACYYFCQMLDIELVRLSDTALLSDDVELTLPDSQTVLVLCDPVWICGMPLSATHIDRIGRWQRRTGSLVLVDGTFQYTKWNQADIGELSSRFPPDLTFRVVCPTKALAIHGVRFSYMLMPAHLREEIRYPCSNLTGATGTFNDWAAVRMMEQMNSSARNLLLIEYIAQRHDSLLRAGIITSALATPSASYYTFAKLAPAFLEMAITMDQRFFDLTGADGLVRINLLYPGWGACLESDLRLCAESGR